jgi:glucan 1,3-beta-glucosidase
MYFCIVYLFWYFCLLFRYKCNAIEKIRGVNIGGWLVLEPWITPSLFYPFLGKNNNKIGMDMYTFCEILGPIKANNILLNHWSTWVTEKHIQILSENKINLLRIPIGDWMYVPYGPFSVVQNDVKCTDGSLEALDYLFSLAQKHNIRVLLDLHGVKGSQNGFDNSGQAIDVQIVNNTFQHWEIRKANWIGDFDIERKSYPIFNQESIRHSKTVLLRIIKKYYNYPMLFGLCVLNEPWEFTPETFLKEFYQDIFNMFTEYMSQEKVFVIHDSFRSNIWENFKLNENSKNITILIDTHQYTAWNSPYSSYEDLIKSASGWQSPRLKYKYVIGEWSLAIDNCEMWLNGFMDNVPNYPLFDCLYKDCPYNKQFKYELSQSLFGPFGTGESYPRKNSFGNYECPSSIPLSKHFNTPFEEKQMVEELFVAKSNAFEKETAGWIFWNFRTESLSYQWDYLAYLTLIGSINTELTDAKKSENKENNLVFNAFIWLICLLIIMYLIYIYVLYIHSENYDHYGYEVIQIKHNEKQTYDSINV